MKVELVDYMGSDLSVVNAARVSFDKQHYEFDVDKDGKLINYLARNGHWTPFAHTSVTFKFTAPLFVARQLAKHQVGLVWNEVSRRYVDSEPGYHRPCSLRLKAGNVKQGSSNQTLGESDFPKEMELLTAYNSLCSLSTKLYNNLLENGVCPEQARMVLPQSMLTEWYWTGNLASFARVANLRLDPATQWETRSLVSDLNRFMNMLFPVSWAALTDIEEPEEPE